jgi:DNA-binding protein H-NS
MPHWLRAAQNAGVNPAFFRIETKAQEPALVENPTIPEQKDDPRQLDLFA